MKKIYALSAAALFCACAPVNQNDTTPIKDSFWNQDSIDICAGLLNKNQQDLQTLQTRYADGVIQEIASLYQELNQQSNAVCRSRIAKQTQIERLKELRTEYLEKINLILSQEKGK